MNYLISSFDCVLFAESKFKISKWVKYKIIPNKENLNLIIPGDYGIPFMFDLNHTNENVVSFKHKFDTYYFLFAKKTNDSFATKINFKNKEVFVSLSNSLLITIDGVLNCEEDVDNLKFSHYEIFQDFCLIYFVGERNFVVALDDKQVCFSSYYDEYNESENEKYFMHRLHDSLNHGKVFHIKGKENSSYLVYLDDNDMFLKNEFVSFVFLDCVRAENFKYCNNLLCDNLKFQNAEEIKSFFPKFDFYYPLEENVFVLANKNTLAGIFEFEIENNKIVNIRQC